MPKYHHAVLYGDSHFRTIRGQQVADFQTLDVVKSVILDVQPTKVIHMGDLFDCNAISRFPKDPRWRESLQGDIDAGCLHLVEMASILPGATELHLLEGNHEERLTRTIWGMTDVSRQLAGLDIFEKYVNWPAILQEAGVERWRWHPYYEQPVTNILPKIYVKHGTKLANGFGASGRSAFKEWQTYCNSGASGHTHRLGDFLHRSTHGVQRWIETGCTCLLDLGYGKDYDWHTGCVVITYDDTGSWFSAELVYIEQGKAYWRGIND